MLLLRKFLFTSVSQGWKGESERENGWLIDGCGNRYAAVLVVFMDGIREQADPELKRLAPGLEKFMNTTLDLLEGRGG